MRNSILAIFVFFLLLPLVNANGLVVQNGTIFLNKTVGIEKTFIFDLQNTDSFAFYNITIDSLYVSMQKIPILLNGQLAHVTATITNDNDFNGDIRIKGFYYAELGSTNETHMVNVGYNSGIEPCDFSIIEGDTIFWKNIENYNLELKNSVGNVKFADLLINGNYSQTFLAPLIFTYYYSWIGFLSDDVCTITVLDSEGLIQNPELDGILNIDLKVEHTPTTLDATFLINEYDMNFYDTEEGVFLLKNTGSNIAKNIKIEVDWFSFLPNNFDLNSGLSKTVSYSINPDIDFTNETNKTHVKELTITGNFLTITEDFDVFIKYADIDSGNYSESDNLLKIIEQFCEDNPEICTGTPKVIYRDSNDTEVNVTIATGQLRKIFEYIYNQSENDKEYQKIVKELLYEFNQTVYSVEQSQNKSSFEIENLRSQSETSSAVAIFTLLGICGAAIIGGGGYLIFHFWRKKKLKKLRTV